MQKRYLGNYKEFRCTADKCYHNCCTEWTIDVDDESLRRYREYLDNPNTPPTIDPDYKENMANWIDFDHKVFLHRGVDCAFQREDGLCFMQRNLGEEYLCITCDMFPRHIEEFPSVREFSVSAACPEVARYMMALRSPIEIKEELDGVIDGEDYEDFNEELYEKLLGLREIIVDILTDDSKDIYERFERVLQMMSQVQDNLDEGELENCDSEAAEYKTNEISRFIKPRVLKASQYRLFYETRRFREVFGNEMEECDKLIFETLSDEDFEKALAEFRDSEKDLSIQLENISLYYIYTYFCGAVYDDYVYALARLAVYSAETLELLWLGRWLKNGKTITEDEKADLLHSYSRELENAKENFITMRDLLDGQI